MTTFRILGLFTAMALWNACSNSDREFSDNTGGAGGADASTGGSGAETTGGSGGASGGSGPNGGTGGSGADAGSGGTAGEGTAGTAGSGTDGGATDAGFTCASDDDCDDDNLCNGAETCVDGRCEDGTQAADGTVCIEASAPSDAGIAANDAGDAGDGGVVAAPAARENICWQGACLPACDQDSECNDGNVCNGTETCSPTSGTCQQGSPLACDDGDACTANECDETRGCFYSLIDEDGDGHAPDSLGACGDDCDDTDDTVFTGAQELCDQKDNNCDGNADEGARPTWYVDCDGDTFAAGTNYSVADQCDPPTAPSTTQCPNGADNATWTTTEPTAGQTDCWDYNTRYRPRNSSENATAWGTPSDVDSSAPTGVQHDFNCDTVAEQRYTTVVSVAASCSLVEVPPICKGCPTTYKCSGSQGWVTSVPECGSSGSWTYCTGTKSCSRTTRSDTQECR